MWRFSRPSLYSPQSPLTERKTGYLKQSLNHQFDSALRIIEGKPVGMAQYVLSPERNYSIRHSGMFISGMEKTDRGNTSEIHSMFVDSSFEATSRSFGSPRGGSFAKKGIEVVEGSGENTEIEGSENCSEDEIKKKEEPGVGDGSLEDLEKSSNTPGEQETDKNVEEEENIEVEEETNEVDSAPAADQEKNSHEEEEE